MLSFLFKFLIDRKPIHQKSKSKIHELKQKLIFKIHTLFINYSLTREYTCRNGTPCGEESKEKETEGGNKQRNLRI